MKFSNYQLNNFDSVDYGDVCYWVIKEPEHNASYRTQLKGEDNG